MNKTLFLWFSKYFPHLEHWIRYSLFLFLFVAKDWIWAAAATYSAAAAMWDPLRWVGDGTLLQPPLAAAVGFLTHCATAETSRYSVFKVTNYSSIYGYTFLFFNTHLLISLIGNFLLKLCIWFNNELSHFGRFYIYFFNHLSKVWLTKYPPAFIVLSSARKSRPTENGLNFYFLTLSRMIASSILHA